MLRDLRRIIPPGRQQAGTTSRAMELALVLSLIRCLERDLHNRGPHPCQIYTTKSHLKPVDKLLHTYDLRDCIPRERTLAKLTKCLALSCYVVFEA